MSVVAGHPGGADDGAQLARRMAERFDELGELRARVAELEHERETWRDRANEAADFLEVLGWNAGAAPKILGWRRRACP